MENRTARPILLFAALVASAACSDDDDDTNRTAAPDYERGLPFTEPEERVSEDGELRVDLRSQAREVDISGATVEGTVYEDAFVGPTLRLAPGDTLFLTLENGLTQHTNIHYHGMHVSPSGNSDNVFLMIHSGESQDYEVAVPADHARGTFWYHSHMHMDSESQVFGGLSGVLIVDGLSELLPEAYRSVPERVIALKDLQVENGAIVADDIDSNAPTVRTVNGLVEPSLSMRPGETELWRIANIGADIFYDVALESVDFTVVTEDGNPVERIWTAEHLVLPPGKRYDVLVTAPDDESELVFETLAYDQGGDQYPRATLATVDVDGDPAEPLPPLVGGLVATSTLQEQTEIAERREFVFSGDDTSNNLAINGKPFDTDRIDAEPKLGTVEEWTLRNTTPEQHPFHIHVNDFRVLSVNAEPYDARNAQDTVILPPNGGEVVVRIPFADFTGKFVFHCHILAHEDGGMMATVNVVE